ncbi:MAG: heme lyase CcmF/NrfE family subunit [Actinomycetota bacterium]
MTASVGNIALLSVLFLSIFSLGAYAYGIYRKDRRFIDSGRYGYTAIFGLLTLASVLLVYAFVTKDYSIRYVAEYSSSDLPLLYKLSAFWAGQSGSLLFWIWFLSLFVVAVIWRNRKSADLLYPYTAAVIGVVQVLFAVLVSVVTTPFELLPTVPLDGMGLNPLLQNPGMILHPPTLLLGYVGFTIPFAYAAASLLLGRTDNWWIQKSRQWTLLAWIFLAIGNIIGGWWAYVVLGWGGYWGWDPVENASLMPWLVATAYLHSVMIQERRKMLKGWNIALITLTFELSLVGTLLVRSGILSSVHAFGESSIGSVFIFFILASTLFMVVLATYRARALKSEGEFDSILSRESSFLFNNLIFTGLTFTILWGTFFPLISEAFTGNKISVKAPFFNQVTVPLGLALLILIGICPLISWKKATSSNFHRNFLTPLIAGVAGTIPAIVLGMRSIGGLITVFGSIFVLVTIAGEFYRGVKTRMRLKSEGALTGLYNLVAKQKRRYGGHIVHIGAVIGIVGIMASNTYQVEVQKSVPVGGTIKIKNYEVVLAEPLNATRRKIIRLEGVKAKIYKDGKLVHVLAPVKATYPNSEQPNTEIVYHSNYIEDLYLIYGGAAQAGKATVYSLKVLVNPLVPWIWIGSWIMLVGSIIAFMQRPPRREA